MPEPKLTRQAFAAALKSGRGRALQYVRQYGLSEVGDLVLEACLKNQAYDRQCEGSRAAWLFAMFHGTEDEGRFSAAIRATLSSLPPDADSYDLEQLSELAAMLAKAGNDDAAAVLRSRVLNQSLEEDGFWYGFRPLVAVEGVSGLVALARRFGQHLLTDPSGWSLPPVDYLTKGLGICDAAKEALQALAKTDGDIKRYLDNQEEQAREQKDQEENPAPGRQALTLDGLLEDASREVDQSPGQYMIFGRHATADELKQVLQRLVEETREAVILRLLWVFRRTPLPDLHPRIWALADARDEALRAAAIAALAQSRDSRVGELGRARLRSGAFTAKDYGTLDLLVRNYQASDAQLIVSALALLAPLVPDEDEAHSLAQSLLDIFMENPACTSLELLRWIYGFTPCTICRGTAVKNMADLGILSPDIAAECVDDAEEEVRQVVASPG